MESIVQGWDGLRTGIEVTNIQLRAFVLLETVVQGNLEQVAGACAGIVVAVTIGVAIDDVDADKASIIDLDGMVIQNATVPEALLSCRKMAGTLHHQCRLLASSSWNG